MRGESAQGLDLDVRSCSSVGSMYLGASHVETDSRNPQRVHEVNVLHEAQDSAKTPWYR